MFWIALDIVSKSLSIYNSTQFYTFYTFSEVQRHFHGTAMALSLKNSKINQEIRPKRSEALSTPVQRFLALFELKSTFGIQCRSHRLRGRTSECRRKRPNEPERARVCVNNREKYSVFLFRIWRFRSQITRVLVFLMSARYGLVHSVWVSPYDNSLGVGVFSLRFAGNLKAQVFLCFFLILLDFSIKGVLFFRLLVSNFEFRKLSKVCF